MEYRFVMQKLAAKGTQLLTISVLGYNTCSV